MINDELLHKWVNGTLTASELAAFKKRPEYGALVELYQNTEHITAPTFDEEVMLKGILKTDKKATTSSPTQGRRVLLSTWLKYGVAASVLLLVGLFFWSQNSGGSSDWVRYEVAQGETLEGTLPDASTFVLNAGSSLSYKKSTWTQERVLELHGEAFFKVKKGEVFKVVTPTGGVQVLGTQFNVWSRNKQLEVKCQSGRVAILDTDGKVLTPLRANYAIRLKGQQILAQYQLPNAEYAQSWVNGIYRFRKVPLSEVLAEIERQFGITIDAADVNINETLSCSFQKGDLDLALQTCLKPLGITYEKQGDTVQLKQ